MDWRLVWRALRARYRDEKVELNLIRDAISCSDLVCDIGSNKGSYLFWMARWAGQVVAFEPQQDLAAYLKRSFGRRSNVTIEAKGVFSESGQRMLFIPPDAPASASFVHKAGQELATPVVSLDEYFPADRLVSLLKIDVEGAELDVFRGSKRILTESGPVLLFECEDRHCDHSIHEVFSFLETLGYVGHFVCGDRLLPLADFNLDIHQKREGERFWDRPNYCNNFFFARDLASTRFC